MHFNGMVLLDILVLVFSSDRSILFRTSRKIPLPLFEKYNPKIQDCISLNAQTMSTSKIINISTSTLINITLIEQIKSILFKR